MNQSAAFCILVQTTLTITTWCAIHPCKSLKRNEIWEWLFQLVIPFVVRNNYQEWFKSNKWRHGLLGMSYLGNQKCWLRPHLEYAVQVWVPTARQGNWGIIMEIKDCQRQFTRIIEGMGLLPYRQRLQRLRLTTLLESRMRGYLKGLGQAILGNFSTDQMIIELTKISK